MLRPRKNQRSPPCSRVLQDPSPCLDGISICHVQLMCVASSRDGCLRAARASVIPWPVLPDWPGLPSHARRDHARRSQLPSIAGIFPFRTQDTWKEPPTRWPKCCHTCPHIGPQPDNTSFIAEETFMSRRKATGQDLGQLIISRPHQSETHHIARFSLETST